jgi:hypothetical protein
MRGSEARSWERGSEQGAGTHSQRSGVRNYARRSERGRGKGKFATARARLPTREARALPRSKTSKPHNQRTEDRSQRSASYLNAEI